MKVRMDEKQRSIAKTAVWIFTICMLIGIAVWRWSALVGVLKKLLGVLAPIIIGLVLAYLLSNLYGLIRVPYVPVILSIITTLPIPSLVRAVLNYKRNEFVELSDFQVPNVVKDDELL